MEKTLKPALIVLIVVIFSFVATYSAFLIKKEADCKKSLYSADCYRSYEGYAQLYWSNLRR